MDVFWVIARCRLVQIYRSFGGSCLRYCLDGGGNKYRLNVGILCQTARHYNLDRRRENAISYMHGLFVDTVLPLCFVIVTSDWNQ